MLVRCHAPVYLLRFLGCLACMGMRLLPVSESHPQYETLYLPPSAVLLLPCLVGWEN